MQQKIIKIISALLAIVLLYANSAAVVSYAVDELLTAQELENQKTTTNNSNVEFDVYYEGGSHTGNLDITSDSNKLNLKLKVKDTGYLKDATVTFSDVNFTISDDGTNSDRIKEFNSDASSIKFNQINAGEEIVKSLNLAIKQETKVNQNIMNKDNKVTLSATYVNAKGKEEAISKDIMINTNWNLRAEDKDKSKAVLNYEQLAFVPYEINNTNKLIVQAGITSRIEGISLPIESTTIEVDAKKINNELPEEVVVMARKTYATNGDGDGVGFTKANYNYDKASEKITINVANSANSEGNISWQKNTSDDFVVTYIYSEDVLNAVKNQKTRVEFSANSKISIYHGNDGVTGFTAKVNGYQEYIGKVGDVVEFEVGVPANTQLNKGYMYNNKTTAAENKKETKFTVSYVAKIPYSAVVDEVIINQDEDKLVTADNTEISASTNTYNTRIAIPKTEFVKILGEEGTVTILSGEKEIAVVNKDLEKDGWLIANISNADASKISMKTSKPQTEGLLYISVDKAIKTETTFTVEQIQKFAKLRTSATQIVKSGNEEITSNTQISEIALTEPTQKANIKLNKDTLSTVIKNEDVEISVTLENDSIDDVMFKQPTVKIDLPTNIETLEVKSSELYFDDELSIKETKGVENSDGTKSIIVTLDGTQTKYNNVAAKGATIKINTNITLNKLTPTTDTQVKLTVQSDGNTIEGSTILKYVAPVGIVTTNSVTGYNAENNELTTISGEGKTAIIKTNAEARQATYTMNVINNYTNTLDNVVVLGRTPFAGNKDLASNKDLGSNIDLTLATGITVSNIDASRITVYYSENGEATADLNNANNGWSTSASDMSKVKSYMIALSGTMNIGEMFTFSYKANIPANLEHEKSAYETYAMYYTNNKPEGAISDKAYASTIGLTTGTMPKLTASLSSDIADGSSVQSGALLKYKLTVENEGSEDSTDATLTIPLPDSSITYVEKDESSSEGYKKVYDAIKTISNEENNKTEYVLTLKLDTIKAKSKLEKDIWLLTQASSEEKEFSVTGTVTYKENLTAMTNTLGVKLTAKYFNIKLLSNRNNLREKEDYQVLLTFNAIDARERITQEETVTEVVNRIDEETQEEIPEVKTTTKEVVLQEERKFHNTKVTVELPEELTLQSVKNQKQEDKSSEVKVNGNKLTIDIAEISDTATRDYIFTFTPEIKRKDTYSKEISLVAKIKADESIEEESNTVTAVIGKPAITVEQTSNLPSTVAIKATEEFAYRFEIKNISPIEITGITLTDYLPKELIYNNIKITYSTGASSVVTSKNSDGNPYLNISSLKAGQTVVIEVNVSANRVDEDTIIKNKAIVTQSEIGTIETNEIKNTIKKYVPNTNPDPDNPDVPVGTVQKIIGTVWVDSNGNGEREQGEAKVSGITVLLLNNETGKIAKQTTTDENGMYAFEEVSRGRYTVIFLYDSSKYSATKYQATGVAVSTNSDALDKLIEYEGKQVIAGVTEEIVIEKENKYDIDLGIVEDAKFDLKLDKVVSKITVNNKKGSTEHNYDKNFAKIDFESKYVDSSTMIVEYKITVTNEGAVPGYAKKIADYLPSELKFNSELNTDWYEGKDGTIYNASLANTIINPGESKELKLILTKSMTQESFGLITNKAEINEATNDYGLADVDSTPGNQSTNEDDYSIANVLTGVKTGEAVVYITLAITIATIIGVGTYIIKKRVIK